MMESDHSGMLFIVRWRRTRVERTGLGGCVAGCMIAVLVGIGVYIILMGVAG